VSERRFAQAAVRESEARYRTLIHALSQIVWRTSADGKITEPLPTWQAFTGQSPDEILGNGWTRAIHPEDAPGIHAQWRHCIATRAELNWEMRIRRHDGVYRRFTVRGVPVLSEAGDLREWVGVCGDVTEQRSSEKATAELAAIVAGSDEAIYSVTLEGEVISWNGGAERLYGYRADEIIGRPLALLHPDNRITELRSSLHRTAQGERIDRFATIRIHRDGHLLDVSTTISPLRDGAGAVVGASVIARDNSASRKVQTALEQAKSAAEAASRAKSEFLANMSHEIRTPMNGVVGMTELLLNTEVTPEQREYLELMRGSADAMLEVINHILDFSKLESGRMELKALPFSLRECLEDTLKSLAPSADRKGLEIACRVGGDTADALIGDAGCLRQVVVNLVGNAIKFTEQGEVTVTVSAEPEGESRQRIRVAVSDTGIGVAKDKQTMIFDAFAQADGSSTRHYGGTGLGLSISRQLVALLGGELRVESESGRGSVFSFTAPFELQRRRPSRPWHLPAGLGDPGQHPVLLVDDHAASRDALRDALEQLGLWVIAADSGPAALELARLAARNDTPPRLLFIDSRMPEMDGFQLVEALRAGPCPLTPVIMLLGAARDPGETARCQALGLETRLTKPVRTSELRERLLAALAGAAAPAARGAGAAPPQDVEPPLRILIAEDNPVNLRYAQRLLEKRGHTVTAAVNGREALTAHAGAPFDIIIMDVQMPEMSGLEATVAIRQMESVSGAHVPIIALTAHSLPVDEERCRDAGMDDYVSKPLRIEALLAALERNAPEPPTPAAPAPGRRADLLARVGGDAAMLAEIAELFEQDAQRQLKNLAAAVEQGDAEAIRFTAHSLKGSAANFADSGTVAAAERLETLARGGRLSGVEAARRRLESEVHRLRAELSAVREECVS
jgi:PAS domain S-box-containing protein